MQVVVQISRICLNLLKEGLLRKEERAGKSVSLTFTALKFLLADQVEALAPKVKENVPKFMCHIKENSDLWFFSLRHRNKKYITVINKNLYSQPRMPAGRGIFPSGKANFRRNTLCIARKFNAACREKTRPDGV